VFSGGSITLHASASLGGDVGNPTPLTSGTWDPGDGSGLQAIDVSNSRVLELDHVYTGSPGQPFTATISVMDAGGNTYSDTFKVQIQAKTLDVEANMAIDKSLWYLHKAMKLGTVGGIPTGNWTSSNAVAATSGATQAFEINGHREIGNPLEDPYADNARRGLRWLQNNIARVAINSQAAGNPDTNGNGYGLRTTGGSEIYVGGQIVDAFVASGTPDALAVIGPEAGRTYQDVVTDLMNAYSWGQDDSGGDRGGWIYTLNGNNGADSSSSQWWAIGALASDPASVPQFVRDENLVEVAYLQAAGLARQPTDANYGACSYRGGGDANNARTASCLVLMSADGVSQNDPNFGAAMHGDIYDMYALAKAMRLAKNDAGESEPIELLDGAKDWYRDEPLPNSPTDRRNGLARYLVGTQGADGHWPSLHGHVGAGELADAFATIIL
jgi:hypothetical protein